jgi:chromosome segregation protein
MQLEKLEIKGFKSFGDKTTIHFNKGVTAIVGPNGCGKSNVVDAIRWVLGEQSTRMLRSEKMENIIFNGTKTRKSANLAEVSLTFDNTKNILPTDYSSVTITRKLYRNGESEYRINNIQCRLKDISDLFLDTGIGADSYAIIELKMIDEIIANKEGSRRNLFEEASGISKYKLRKKQTFNKLKDTEADLSRVDDLLFEIKKNLKTLENQAKKTERYYKLKEQYKNLSIQLATFKISNFRTSLEQIEQKEEEQNEIKNFKNVQITSLEAEIQEQKLAHLIKEKNLAIQQKTTQDFVAKIRAYESDKKIQNEQLKYLQAKEFKLIEELEKQNNQLLHVHYNSKRLKEEKLQEEQNLILLSQSLETLKNEVDDLKNQQQFVKSNLELQNKLNLELQNQVYQAEKEIEVFTIQKEVLTQESKRNLDDTNFKETELNAFNNTIVNIQFDLSQKKQLQDALIQLEELLKGQINSLDELIQEKKELINQTNRKLDAKQNEFNLTKSLVDNLEGFPESIRFLKKNSQWSKNAPLLSDILFCLEDYRIAVESFLEPYMNYYVVETFDDAIEAIRLLSNAARGKANFFILNQISSKIEIETQLPKSAISALKVIEIEEKYRQLGSYLLQNVYLIPDEQEQNLNHDILIEGIVLIGKSGRFYKTAYTLTGGSVGLFEGKRIGRAKNLDNLAKAIKTLITEKNALNQFIEENSLHMATLKSTSKRNELETLERETTILQNELISLKTKQEQYHAFIQNSQNRKSDIEFKLEQINNSILEISPKIIQLRSENQTLQLEYNNQQQNFTQLNEVLTIKSTSFNTENIKFHQQQNKVNGIDKDIDYRNTQIENLEINIKTAETELFKTKEEIQQIFQHVDHHDEDLIVMYQQKEEMEKAVEEAEIDYFQTRGNINEKESLIIELRKNKDLVETLLNELKDKKNVIKIDLNSLKERLSVEFNMVIEDILDNLPPTENEEEIREKVIKLKNSLDDFGAINPMAMEAYQEMESRYAFIEAQKKDLSDARISLMATIKEIDDTAKDKFMEAFVLIRENFMKVFRSLFNQEDSCDLLLSTPNEPLTSDIEIIAKPKGKRPLSINQLSGGEKTLTATALLFSLYLLKPAPFCIFDEVDAPLDDTNIDKFNNIIRTFSGQSQFIVVSHNKKTIASTDIIYGVTMVEQGVSKVVAVDLREVA